MRRRPTQFDTRRLGGGRTRARTWDPMIKSHLLYQLSYAPGTWPRKAFARGGRLAKRFGDVQQTIGVFPALSRGRKREKPPDPGGFSSDIRGSAAARLQPAGVPIAVAVHMIPVAAAVAFFLSAKGKL